MIYHGKKVRIRVENFYQHKKDLSDKFLKFLERNEDTIFKAKYDKKTHLYELKEDPTWLFHEKDLELVPKKGK